jgi:hypothetical protein
MKLEQLQTFLAKEWRALITDAVRPRVEAPAPEQREADLIERASEGSAARTFLESRHVQDFMAKAEAQMTRAMLDLPLDADKGRRDLAVAIQAHRQLMRYLMALAQDGASAERELVRLSSGRREYF